MRQPVGAAAAGPVIGNEHGVRPDRAHHHRLQRDRRAARRYLHPVTVFDAELLGEPRVDLESRLRILLDQRTDAAGLRAGEILAHDAAR